MGGLFSALLTTADSLRAFDRSLSTIQNNVSNANTPGYARQRLTLIPREFDVNTGLVGGVESGRLVSSRDEYSERDVWRQTHVQGKFAQQAADLSAIESVFPVSNNAGVPGALNQFFSSVSSWSVNPNDTVAREVVLDRAGSAARAFNFNATALGEAASSADRELRTVVQRINGLAENVRDISAERRTDRRKLDDPALDAKLHSTLEELAQYVDFNVIHEIDGSVQLLLGGQTPLVIGNEQYEIKVDFSLGPPRILNDNGVDIGGQVHEGSLRGLLETRNTLLPQYTETLNRLAESFADRVNQVLAGGLDAGGSSPVQDLYTYDTAVGAAFSLATNPLTASQLAAADLSAPGGNANALALSAISRSSEIDGVTFTQFYGQLGADVGRDLVRAHDGLGIQRELVLQAQELRADRSGVSLDEEAARLVEGQRAYQASAQLFQVLNGLTDTLMSLLN